MDINYLRYAIEIYECGSINKAAGELNMSQPNLSVCLRNLENELGFSIFTRSSNGIRLTGEGNLFIKSAKAILQEMSVIENIPALIQEKDNLSFSCTYSFDVMNSFVKFKSRMPPVNYEDILKETGLIQVTRDLIEKRYRMTFFYCFDSIADRYYDLAAKYGFRIIPVAEKCPLIVLASKKSEIARRKSIDFREIKDLKFVMYQNFQFGEWLRLLGFSNDRQILYVYDRGGLIDIIRQSDYATVMMKRYTEVYSNDCAEIPITDSPISMNGYVMYRNDYEPNIREREFIKVLKKTFRKR